MTMTFAQLAVGSTFETEGKQYRKVETVWLNCCTKKHNAELIENVENKILVPDDTITTFIN